MVPRRFSRRLLGLLAAGPILWLAASASAAPALPRGNPASRLAGGAANAEAWDLTAQFESNHWLFARFMITNDGPGKRTGVAIGHLVFPDGHVEMFKNGRLEGEWTLARDGLALKVGSSRLDLHEPRRLHLGNNKGGPKVSLNFGAGAFVPALEQTTPPAFWLDLIQAGTPVEGSIVTRNSNAPTVLRGRVALTHIWTAGSESASVHRQIEFLALLGEAALYVVSLEPPQGPARRWLFVSRGGKVLYQTSEFELTLGAPFVAGADAKYPVPGTLHVRAPGLGVDIQAEAELLRSNPMEIIPNPFRFLLSLTSAPRRVWLRSTFRLELAAAADRPGVARHGSGVIAASFTNPFKEKK